MSNIHSFSIPPDDKEAAAYIAKLKAHCKKKGLNFSHIVLEAILKLTKDLNL